MTGAGWGPWRLDRNAWRAHGAMALFAALVSGSFSIGSRAAPFIDPNAMMALRFALAAGVMGGVALSQGVFRPAATRAALGASIRTTPWRFPILGGLYGAYFVLMFEALRLASPASLGAVFTLTPLMTAGAAFLIIGQRAPAAQLCALALGAAGALWVIFRGDLSALLGLDIGAGEALFFIGAMCHSLYTPLLRRWNGGLPILAFTFGTLTAAFGVLLIIGGRALMATDWASLPPIVWLALLYLGVATTALTSALLQFAALQLSASKVMAYTYLVPSLIILYEGLSGAGWAPVGILPGVAATLGALLLLLRE